MSVKREKGSLELHQKPLIEKLLKETDMCGAKVNKVPINTNERLVACKKVNSTEECGIVSGTIYRSIVGRLNYLACTTRPDLMFAVSYISQFNKCPHPEHLSAVKLVLRYLAGTSELGIRYEKEEKHIPLAGSVDADWAQCPIDRRSYTGYRTMLCGGPISWEAKKQSTVALSSTEAEYMALTCAPKEIVFIKSIVIELGLNEVCGKEVILNCDNQGSIQLALNNGYSPRSKHIDVRHHYIREQAEDKNIKLKYINTGDNLADIFTKPLCRILHWKIAENIVQEV